MNRISRAITRIHADESGHAQVGVTSLVAGIGGIILAVGVAADSDAAAIVGAVVLGLGVFATSLGQHMGVDYDIYARLEKLEGKE